MYGEGQIEVDCMKNITLSADEKLIEAARKRAQSEHTTLNEKFQRWLEEYTHQEDRMRRYDEIVSTVKGTVRIGQKLSRDEMNER
jgi:molybdenum-dependent DNA-binding transcriptional regulator ModE